MALLYYVFALEELRDQKIKILPKITDTQLAKSLFDELVAEFPNHLPTLVAQLKHLTTRKVWNGVAWEFILTL